MNLKFGAWSSCPPPKTLVGDEELKTIRPIWLIGLIGLIGLVGLPFAAAADHGSPHDADSLLPLVECGQTVTNQATGQQSVPNPCNVCHLFAMVNRGLNAIWWIVAVPVATVMFIYAGSLMLTAGMGGGSGAYERGKKIAWNVLVGLLIAFFAWLIVDTIIKVIAGQSVGEARTAVLFPGIEYGPWNTIKCTAPPSVVTGTGQPAPSGELPLQPPTAPTPHLDNATAVSLLTSGENGLKITSTGNCSIQTNSTCTSLQGLPEVAANELLAMQRRLKDECSSCTLTITGGTEIGHKTHGPGKAVVDLSSKDQRINDFIKRTVGVSNPAVNTWYNGGDNHFYFYEKDHWHVCLTSSCAPHQVGDDQKRGL